MISTFNLRLIVFLDENKLYVGQIFQLTYGI